MKRLAVLCLLAAAAMTFAGCEKYPSGPGNGETPFIYPESEVSHVTRIAGRIIEGMPEPDEAEEPFTMKLQVIDPYGESDGFVASCPVAADGSFALELPDSVEPDFLRPSYYNEEEGLTISDRNIKMTVGPCSLEVFDGNGDLIGDVGYYFDNGDVYGRCELIYVDGDYTAAGTISFQDEDGTVLSDAIDLNLKRGWNWTSVYFYGADVAVISKMPSGGQYYLGRFTE